MLPVGVLPCAFLAGSCDDRCRKAVFVSHCGGRRGGFLRAGNRCGVGGADHNDLAVAPPDDLLDDGRVAGAVRCHRRGHAANRARLTAS